MPKDPKPDTGRGGVKGSFAGCKSGLLEQFAEPAGRRGRKWLEMFGHERRREEPRPGEPFIARGARKSSSDS